MATPEIPAVVNKFVGAVPATAQDTFSVTPSDATVFGNWAAALYVGTGGDVTVRTVRGTSQLFTAVPSGTILPVACDKVLSTGTTASTIVALVY